MTHEELQKLFFLKSPYDGFPIEKYPERLYGWHSDNANFRKLIQDYRPKLYIEVGSWVGGSAIHAGKLLEEFGFDCPILCVDTWLGAQEFWRDLEGNQRYHDLQLESGYPTVYRQFLANVIHNKLDRRIVPLPQHSLIGARLCDYHTLKAEMIYIDGSHDEGDVFEDIQSYWKVLRPGGVIFGDDYDEFWPGVIHDVQKFAADHMVKVESREGFWMIEKPKATARKSRAKKTAKKRPVQGKDRVNPALLAESAVLRARLTSLQAQMEVSNGEKNQTIQQLRAELDHLHVEHSNVLQSLQHSDSRIVDLEGAADFYNRKYQETLESLAHFETQVNSLNGELQTEVSRSAFFQEEFNTERAKNGELEGRLKAEKKKTTGLEGQLQMEKKKSAGLERKLKAEKKRILDLGK